MLKGSIQQMMRWLAVGVKTKNIDRGPPPQPVSQYASSWHRARASMMIIDELLSDIVFSLVKRVGLVARKQESGHKR